MDITVILCIVFIIAVFILKHKLTSEVDEPVCDVAELIVRDDRDGEGRVAEPGMTVEVHYTGWLYSEEKEANKGKEFDSSRYSKDPFKFSLGAGRVIRGWDEGVAGMKEGGARTLIIPSSKAYGPLGAGTEIPPNSAIVFEVELLKVS